MYQKWGILSFPGIKFSLKVTDKKLYQPSSLLQNCSLALMTAAAAHFYAVPQFLACVWLF
jgi:hypothetical protein